MKTWTFSIAAVLLTILSSVAQAQAPIDLATGLSQPRDLLLAHGKVYFADNTSNDGILKSVPQSGGSATTLISGAAVYDSGQWRGINRFAVVGDTIYGGYGGYVETRLFHAPAAGGATTLIQSISGGTFIGVADGDLYYSSGFSDIYRRRADGTGSPVQLLTGVFARSPTLDGEKIFFVDYGSRDVRSLDVTSLAVETLITGNSTEGEIFVDSHYVYWTTPGSIKRSPRTGGTVSTLLSGNDVFGLASDGDAVYYLESEKLKRIDLVTGEIRELASLPGAAAGAIRYLVADGSGMYWADTRAGNGAGKISRFTRDTPLSQDHFEITTATETPTVGTPFAVTLTAKSGGGAALPFTGDVALSATTGQVSPLYVIFNGESSKEVSVVLDAPGVGLRLQANGSGIQGESKPLQATGGTVSTGRLSGRVRQVDGTTWPSAEVVLVKKGMTPYTDSAGVEGYDFPDLPCGEYTLTATIPSGNSSGPISVQVPCGTTKTKNVTVPGSACNPLGKTPILLVPGMMGSTTLPLAPYLPRTRPGWESSQWPEWSRLKTGGLIDAVTGLHGSLGWWRLVQDLEGLGYRIDCTIFPVPYDWRLPVETVARDYLKKQIGRARRIAGSQKVNVVAHSMGGLVTRAYIQSPSYENDIERFAMVGTPNRGATNAYALWAGGDPLALGKLYHAASLTQHLVFYKKPAIYPYDFYRLYHEHLLSLSQLLPTYPFLTPLLGGSSRSLACEPNYLLSDLNNPNGPRGRHRNRMAGPAGSSNQVITQVFVGTGESTHFKLRATSRANPCSKRILYQDGLPFWKLPLPDEGDGTVLQSSAFHDFIGTSDKEGKHTELIKLYIPELIDFLIPTNLRSSLTQRREETEVPTPVLTVTVGGRAQPLAINPTGQATGVDPATGEIREEIPGAEVDLDNMAGTVSLENPATGTYTVRLKGAFDEDQQIQIHLVDADFQETETRHLFQTAGAESTFTFTLAASGEDRISVQRMPAPPSGLQADLLPGNGTGLSWPPSPTPGVTGYRIYARQADEPSLMGVATVSGTSHPTGDEWAGEAGATPRLYAVAAVLADGRESFLSEVVSNDDRDHDGLKDGDEAPVGTQVDNPDSDGDGLTDGDEVLRGTDPLQADSDGDGYSDGREVNAEADPFDAAVDPTNIPLDFYTLTPCRLLDTRNPAAPLLTGVARTFPATSRCGIPSTAIALAVNVTVVAGNAQGYVRMYPGHLTEPPLTSVLNFSRGQVRSNNAILPLARLDAGTLGALATVSGSDRVDLIVDVTGYFQ